MLGEGGRGWWLAGLVCVFWSWFSVLGGVAFASGGYEPVGSFGGVEKPQAVAVDQSTGDVYVIGLGPPDTVKRFTAAGKGAPFPVVEPYVEGERLIGTPVGAGVEEFAFDRPEAVGIAVDASAGPARGDLYVTGSFFETIDVFSPSGLFLGEVNLAGAVPLSGGEPCGVAVDGAGHIFVGWRSGHVDELAPTDADPSHDVFLRQLENVGGVCSVAAETGGNTFVQTGHALSGLLSSYDRLQWNLPSPAFTPVGVAVQAFGEDLGNDHLFLVENGGVTQLDSSGAVVGSSFGSVPQAAGLAVNDSSGRVYVSEGIEPVETAASNRVYMFEELRPGVPGVVSESSAGVSASSGELRAEITANLLDTHYSFEYGTDTSYSGGVVPVAPGGDIGAGHEARSVSAVLSGLVPGTMYHYRVVAHNAMGSTTGEDHTFSTFGLGGFALPDGRGWEMVSPLEKNEGSVLGIDGVSAGGVVQAASGGQSVTYLTVSAFGDALGNPAGDQYLASRTSGGWASSDLMTPMASGGFALAGEGAPYDAFSSDLGSALELAGKGLNPSLVPSAPAGYQNLYLRDVGSGAVQPLITSAPAQSPIETAVEFQGASPDLKHVVFASPAALTPGAVFGGGFYNLYEWGVGGLAAVNVLPGVSGGVTTPPAELGSGFHDDDSDRVGAVSDDGLRVYFSVGGSLYVREDAGLADARTLPVGSGAGGAFWFATGDGETAYFTQGGDLFVFDAATGVSQDLTVDGAAGGARVQGVLGASPDGSYVWFVADGKLAAGAREGDCNGSRSGEACGLYVEHEGRVRFIGMLAQADYQDWIGATFERTARVSGDGLHVVFMSSASGLTLPAYDNRDAGSGLPDSEVYEYDAVSGGVVCVSCNPTGERPSGGSMIPGGTAYRNNSVAYESRVVSFDGSRVFFDSRDQLALQDSSGLQNVYEYEGGRVSLLSSGRGDEDASFVDASESGDDVFFITDQELVPQDTDQLRDLYDARVGGGFPVTAAPAPCSGDECLPAATQAPVFGSPTSTALSSAGNLPHSVTPKKKAKKKKVVKRKRKVKKRGVKASSKHSRGSARSGKRVALTSKGRG